MKSQKKKIFRREKYLLSFFCGVAVVLLGLFIYRHLWYLPGKPSQMQTEKNLINTRWQWEEIQKRDGSLIQPLPVDTHKFILTFDKNGTFSSTTDCNNLKGKYQVNREVLSMGQIESTLMGCMSESKEIVYKDALENVVSYNITGDTLTFTLAKELGTMKFNRATNNSKEYKRVFEGTLPCADCPGIQTTLTLMSEGEFIDVGEYIMEQVYLDRDVKPLVTKGQWTVIRGTPIDADATVYYLNFDKPNEEMYFLQVDQQHIRQLDTNLNEFSSGLNFTLTKKN